MDMENIVEKPPRRVMVCIDDSTHAQSAFEYYIEHLHKAENEVIVLHVSDHVRLPHYVYAGGVFSGGVGVLPDHTQAEVEDLQNKNKAIEDRYNAKCEKCQIRNKVLIASQSKHGIGDTIVTEAQKHNVNLIVVGSRGLGRIRRTILGSVSGYVIHHSHIATLVCPPSK